MMEKEQEVNWLIGYMKKVNYTPKDALEVTEMLKLTLEEMIATGHATLKSWS